MLMKSAARHLVDADDRRDDQSVVLAGRNLDPVRLADPEPALGDLGDLVAVALDLVFVIHDVALGGQLATGLELDREAIAQRRDQRLLDRRNGVSAAFDLHRVADVELLLLDLEQLLAGRALEDERAPDPGRLAVDLECALAALGLDPEVVADREQLLAHLVARAGLLVVSVKKTHLLLLSWAPGC